MKLEPYTDKQLQYYVTTETGHLYRMSSYCANNRSRRMKSIKRARRSFENTLNKMKGTK